MTLIFQILGLITILISAFYANKLDIKTWYYGIASNLLYIVVFCSLGLTGNAMLQIIWMYISIYAILDWKGSSLSMPEHYYYAISIFTIICILFLFLLNPITFTSSLDFISTIIFVIATYLLITVNRYCWVFFGVANILTSIMLFSLRDYISGIAYVLLTINSIHAFLTWYEDETL